MFSHMIGVGRSLLLGAVCLWAGQAAWADGNYPFPKDYPGGSDPVAIKRFTGSALIGYRADDWEQARYPVTAAIQQDRTFKDLITLEGRRVRAVYLTPAGKSPLEVYRNYEQALTQAGFKKKFSCESNCDDQYFALNGNGGLGIAGGMKWSKGYVPTTTGGSYALDETLLTFNDGRLLVGTLPQGGGETWVMLYVSKAEDATTNYSLVYLQAVTPKPMQTGQVSVLKASDIQTGLSTAGKVAFYGLYFDTGKADIKPESRAQLDEMGKLLKSQPSLQVFIVGHTDGQGQFDSNVILSQQRAQAVVDALVKQQGIDARRLAAKGVASLSPVATNATDDGRARNRRVELVAR